MSIVRIRKLLFDEKYLESIDLAAEQDNELLRGYVKAHIERELGEDWKRLARLRYLLKKGFSLAALSIAVEEEYDKAEEYIESYMEKNLGKDHVSSAKEMMTNGLYEWTEKELKLLEPLFLQAPSELEDVYSKNEEGLKQQLEEIKSLPISEEGEMDYAPFLAYIFENVSSLPFSYAYEGQYESESDFVEEMMDGSDFSDLDEMVSSFFGDRYGNEGSHIFIENLSSGTGFVFSLN